MPLCYLIHNACFRKRFLIAEKGSAKLPKQNFVEQLLGRLVPHSPIPQLLFVNAADPDPRGQFQILAGV